MGREPVDKVAIGARIKEKRLYMRLTQEQLSEMVDISPVFLAQVEGGSKSTSLGKICRIAKALRVTTDYLLLGKQEKGDTAAIMMLLESCNETEREYAEELLKTFLVAMRKKEGHG